MARASSALVLACAFALPAHALDLARGAGDSDVIGCPSPPGIEPHAIDPGVAFVACTSAVLGVFAWRVDPALPLTEALSIPPYLVPVDLNGSLPNPMVSVFVDDVWIEGPTLGWVTTNGHDTAAPFDPQTGQARSVLFEGIVRPSVPAGRTIAGSFTRSDGQPVASFTTNFTSGVLRVGDRLLVATSNFATFGSNPVLYPGTVLLYDVDDSNPAQLVVTPATPPWIVTTDPNPSHLTLLPGGRVAVTNTGRLSLTNPPGASGPGSVDVVDPQVGAILANVPLGNAAPGFGRIAVDPSGSVGLVGSAVLRALYAVDLRGVAALPLPGANSMAQRPSCTGAGTPSVGGVPCAFERVIAGAANPIPIPPCVGPLCSPAPDGYTVEVRFGEGGDFALATEYNDGLVAALAFDPANLATPQRLLRTRFGAAQTAVLTPPIGTFPAETGPGPLLVLPSAGGGFAGTEIVWATNGPDGTLGRGTFSGVLPAAGGDTDGDGVSDAQDNCPVASNAPQTDTAAIGAAGPDGSGDACQCGDASGDGGVRIDDAARIQRTLAGKPPALPAPAKCNVHGLPGGAAGTCDALDVAAIRAALASATPSLPPLCGPATPASP
jgi:hypothetical protein